MVKVVPGRGVSVTAGSVAAWGVIVLDGLIVVVRVNSFVFVRDGDGVFEVVGDKLGSGVGVIVRVIVMEGTCDGITSGVDVGDAVHSDVAVCSCVKLAVSV